MTNALRALEDGSLAERAQDCRGSGVVRLSITNPDALVSAASERVIRSCARALVSELIAYADRMLSLKRLAIQPQNVRR
jgi:hypothetical protein